MHLPVQRRRKMLRTTELITEPRKFDILCGKDKECISHFGSRQFRDVIEAHRVQYQEATTKQEKMDITKNIVSVLNLLSCRFLKYNGQLKGWQEISDIAARDKVSHALRFSNRKTSTVKKKARKHLPTDKSSKAANNCQDFQSANVGTAAKHSSSDDDRSNKLPVLDLEYSCELVGFHDDIAKLPDSLPDSSSLTSWFEAESNHLSLYDPISCSNHKGGSESPFTRLRTAFEIF